MQQGVNGKPKLVRQLSGKSSARLETLCQLEKEVRFLEDELRSSPSLVKGKLLQLAGSLEKLQSEKVDAVVTADLSSGKTYAKHYRNALHARIDAMREHVAEILNGMENPPDELTEIYEAKVMPLKTSLLKCQELFTDERMPSILEECEKNRFPENDEENILAKPSAAVAILQSRLGQLAAIRQRRRSLLDARRVRLIEADLARRADANLARRERQLVARISTHNEGDMLYAHLENEYALAPNNITRRAIGKALTAIQRAQRAEVFSSSIAAHLKRILLTLPLNKHQVFAIEMAGADIYKLLLALRDIYLSHQQTKIDQDQQPQSPYSKHYFVDCQSCLSQ